MKTKKINWPIIFILFFSFFTFFGAEKSYAGCCVNGSTCTNASVASDCATGMTFYSASEDCSLIAACNGTGSGTAATGTNNTTFANPIAFNTVSDLLNAVLNNLMGLIAVISIIFIVIGGIMYMLSGGSEAAITRAKKTWTGAVIGLAIALAAPTFLKTIQTLLGGGGTGGSAQNWVSNALTLKQIALNVLNLLLSIFGVLAIIALIIGGGTYLTAYGDEKKIDSGKRIITYAIIGIVVALAAIVIVRQVGNLLGAKFN
jgi:hypothetical protein